MAESKKEKTTKIVIPSTEHDQSDVFVGINGKSYLIQRDKEVEVSPAIIETLDNAVVNTVKRGKNGKMVPVSYMRYPYRVVK